MALRVKLQPLMHGVRPEYPHLIHSLKPPLEGQLQSDFRPSAKNAKRGLDNATLAFFRAFMGLETQFMCVIPPVDAPLNANSQHSLHNPEFGPPTYIPDRPRLAMVQIQLLSKPHEAPGSGTAGEMDLERAQVQ